MEGNFGPVDEIGPKRAISVKGCLPECFNGELVRVGPNPRWEPVAGYHWFDGDGMIHGLRIKDGNATYVSRYVRTARYMQEEYWGGPKFIKVGDLVGIQAIVSVVHFVLRVAFGVVDVSSGIGTANTGLVYHSGRLLTLHELDKPYAVRVLEDGDLETAARLDYDKKLDHNFTAHPKLDPVTAAPYLRYRVVSKDGVMSEPVDITTSGPTMMHDFAITENYVIFMDLPMCFNLKEMMQNNTFPFKFDKTKPARVGVLPRYAKDESLIRWFELSTCMILHNANAWEEGDEVVLISFRIPPSFINAISEYTGEKSEAFINELWEYRFNLKTGGATERQLGQLQTDFPEVNDQYIGRKSQYVFASLFNGLKGIIGVVKYDLSKEPQLSKAKFTAGGNLEAIFLHGSQRFGSEPVFVPKRPGREVEEDDGHLIVFVHDENTGISEVVVIDAKTMSADPVAVVELPSRVPHGFHALFVSEEQLQSQRA